VRDKGKKGVKEKDKEEIRGGGRNEVSERY